MDKTLKHADVVRDWLKPFKCVSVTLDCRIHITLEDGYAIPHEDPNALVIDASAADPAKLLRHIAKVMHERGYIKGKETKRMLTRQALGLEEKGCEGCQCNES